MSLPANSLEDVTGYVLAGGESRRMGRDKALMELAGRPLIEHALGILSGAGLKARIAGMRTDLDRFAPVIADLDPGRGPLGGICTALARCEAERAIFIPVDMPLLPNSLLTFMIHKTQVTEAPVTTVAVSGFRQSFPVILDRTTLSRLEASLQRGRGGCYAAFEAAAAELGNPVRAVAVEYLVQTGQVEHPAGLPPAFWFLNVNSPADLRRVEMLLSRRVA